MIILFTDFGLQGPYVGQLKSVLYQNSPDSKIIDLMHDAPMFDIKHSACLLNSLIQYFPAGSVFCCVVDPGVGSTRNAIVIKAKGKYFVGPDNGLFEYLVRSDPDFTAYNIVWQPEVLSKTFHGRDIFGPIAAQIENGIFDRVDKTEQNSINRFSWPNDLSEIIYIDHFGNLMTGIRGNSISVETKLVYKGLNVNYVDTYSNMPDGQLCWYINSNQLVEIGLNKMNAGLEHGEQIGEPVSIIDYKL